MDTRSVSDTASASETAAGRVLAGLSAGVVAVAADGRVVTANDAAREHLDFGADSLMPGAYFAELPGVEPLVTMIEDVIRTGRPRTRGEVTLGATSKEIGVSVSPLMEGDTVEGAILLFSNVTERRRVERVAALNRQLADLGELAAGVVHQVRNPLTIITGRAELLLRQLQDDSQREYLESIIQEADQIAESLSTFLQCARPFEFKPRECEAQALIDQSIQRCKSLANDKDVAFETQLRDGLDTLYLDGARTAEALANVVENAIEASPIRGTVTIAVRQDESMTLFSVIDTGRGVQVDPGEDIYSPFFTKKRDGRGLGLSLAQRIVTMQGGTLRHRNTENGGACFEVELPTVHGNGE